MSVATSKDQFYPASLPARGSDTNVGARTSDTGEKRTVAISKTAAVVNTHPPPPSCYYYYYYYYPPVSYLQGTETLKHEASPSPSISRQWGVPRIGRPTPLPSGIGRNKIPELCIFRASDDWQEDDNGRTGFWHRSWRPSLQESSWPVRGWGGRHRLDDTQARFVKRTACTLAQTHHLHECGWNCANGCLRRYPY